MLVGPSNGMPRGDQREAAVPALHPGHRREGQPGQPGEPEQRIRHAGPVPRGDCRRQGCPLEGTRDAGWLPDPHGSPPSPGNLLVTERGSSEIPATERLAADRRERTDPLRHRLEFPTWITYYAHPAPGDCWPRETAACRQIRCPRNVAGNPDSPQAAIFSTSFIDVMWVF